jgi:hypothetical protein
MMKKRTILHVIMILLAAVFIFSVSKLLQPKSSASLAPFTMNMDQMIKKSTLIIEGQPLRSSKKRIDSVVTFRMTTIDVNKVLKGNAANQIVILQTDGIPEEPALATSKKYIFILEPYEQPSGDEFKGTAGAFVMLQAYQGMYLAQKDGSYLPIMDPEKKLDAFAKTLSTWKAANVK